MSLRALLRVALAASLALSGAAQAQLFRAYVSSTGADVNPCNLQQPCRLLPAAITAVASGGEIWMLDSANYNTGTVTIGKSVSILAVPGVVGSIVAINGGPAISIVAGSLNIALRNVVVGPVAGGVAGTYGVSLTGSSTVTIENSVFVNLATDAINVVGAGTVRVSNTNFRNNGGWAVSAQDGGSVVVSGAQMIGNTSGGVSAVSTTATTTVATITNTTISGGGTGVAASGSTTGSVARVSLASSTIERMNIALYSSTAGTATSEVNVGGCMIVDNTTAWSQSGTGATILSLGNNQMSGNAGSVGAKSPLAGQ